MIDFINKFVRGIEDSWKTKVLEGEEGKIGFRVDEEFQEYAEDIGMEGEEIGEHKELIRNTILKKLKEKGFKINGNHITGFIAKKERNKV